MRKLSMLPVLGLLLFSCQNEKPIQANEITQETDTSSTVLAYASLDRVIGLHEQWQGDLDSILERRRLRALVPYSRMHYYIDGTDRAGLSYDAMQAFEEMLNEHLDARHKLSVVFIPVPQGQLLDRLEQGYGDIVAMGLTVTPQRLKRFDFSSPMMENSREVVVSGPLIAAANDTAILTHSPIYVRPSSSYFEHLLSINDSLQQLGQQPIDIQLLDDDLEDEQLLAMINEGLLSATLIEYNLASFWAQTMEELKIHDDLILFSGGDIAYAIRKDKPQLKAAIDAFANQNRRGTLLGNILYNRYLQDTSYLAKAYSREVRQRILQTRDLFVKYGEQYDLDWLILAALGYQESRLQQSAISHAGAVGIMQVRPSTARDPNIGIQRVDNLEDNIHAGTKYLRFLIDNYFVHPDIDSLNAGLFALAAYNAGPYRVQKLREAAIQKGFDHNEWFNNVEIIAAQQIGRETVQYVGNIYKFYTSYRALLRYTQETGVSVFEDR
jgi:membrane-bound lytic murein transglycosylase MltF